MRMESFVFLLISSYWLVIARTGAQLSQYNVPGQVGDALATTSGQLVVSANNNTSGAGSVCRFYNRSLLETLQFPSGTSVLRLALSSDESRLVTCVSNRSCIEYDVNNLGKGPTRVFDNVLASGNYVSLVSAPVIGGGNSLYVGSSNGTVILIGQYGLDGAAGSVSRSSGNLFGVTAGSFTRNWFGGFVAGSYTYFVVLDVSTSPTAMRVLRVCDNSNETSVAAMYETELNCLRINGRIDATSRFAGVSLVNAYPNGSSFEPRLVVGAVTPDPNGGTSLSRVCTFSLPKIDSAIASASSQCSPGALPWRSSSPSSLSCSSTCIISSPGAIPTSSLLQTSELLQTSVSNSTFDLSYTLSFNFESLTLMFLAYTDQLKQAGQSFILLVSLMYGSSAVITCLIFQYNVIDGSSLGVRFSSWPMPGPVTRLTWTSGQNFVYAITTTSVGQ